MEKKSKSLTVGPYRIPLFSSPTDIPIYVQVAVYEGFLIIIFFSEQNKEILRGTSA